MAARSDWLYRLLVFSLALDLLVATGITAWHAWEYEQSGHFRLTKGWEVRQVGWQDAAVLLVPVLVIWTPLCWLAVKAWLRPDRGRPAVAMIAAVLKFFATWCLGGALVGRHVAGEEELRVGLWLSVAGWAAAGGVVAVLYLLATRQSGTRLSEVFSARITR